MWIRVQSCEKSKECHSWWADWLTLIHWKVRLFLCWDLLKENMSAVWYLLDIWQSFSDQSVSFFLFVCLFGWLIFCVAFFMLAAWKKSTKEKKKNYIVLSVSSTPFKDSILPQLSTSDIRGYCAYFLYFFHLCSVVVFFFLAWVSPLSNPTTTIRAELKKNHFFSVEKCQLADLTAALPQHEPSPLLCSEELVVFLFSVGALPLYLSLYFHNAFYCKLSAVRYLGERAESWKEATKPKVSVVT